MKKSRSTGQEAEAAGQNAECREAQAAGQENPAGEPAPGQPEIAAGEPAEDKQAGHCQELEAALAAKEKDFTALSDKYLRLAAEYDNFRRRSQKEKDALYADSITLVIKEILPIVDNLERAGLAAAQYDHEDARKIAEGIALIQKQVEQAFSKLGVCTIDSVGQPFNPTQHEAVLHVEDDSVGAATVVAELQKGYRREDRVIRHSIVKVAN